MNVSCDEEGKTNNKQSLCWVFLPLPSQAQFRSSTQRIKGFSGPVGTGKSAVLCWEAIALMHMNTERHGLVGSPTFAMLRDSTLVSMLDALDQADVTYELRKTDGEISLEGSESVMLLRSLDEPERLRGTNLAWFAVDELSYAKHDAWLRLEARLRDPKAAKLCGFGVWTPQGHDWLYKKFIDKPVAGYFCVRAKPFENRFLLEKTPDYYERLESSYDPKFYSQEVLGEYVNSKADRVYHCFNKSIHIVHHQYDRQELLLWALDFNVSPMSSVVLQKRGNCLVVIDEIVLDRATTEESCMEFENRYRGHAGKLEIFGDASGRNMHTTGGNDYAIVLKSLRQAGFKDIRLRVPSRNPSVIDRVRRVNGMLTNAFGEVTLEVDHKCEELVKDFEEVMFKPDSGVIDKARDPKRTHLSDALGYAIWELFADKPRAGEVDKRLF